jgi:hypothetical protein
VRSSSQAEFTIARFSVSLAPRSTDHLPSTAIGSRSALSRYLRTSGGRSRPTLNQRRRIPGPRAKRETTPVLHSPRRTWKISQSGLPINGESPKFVDESRERRRCHVVGAEEARVSTRPVVPFSGSGETLTDPQLVQVCIKEARGLGCPDPKPFLERSLWHFPQNKEHTSGPYFLAERGCVVCLIPCDRARCQCVEPCQRG